MGAEVSDDAMSDEVARPAGRRHAARPDGRERLLSTAEGLFAVQGFATSLREVAELAGHRNVSAIAYHFGSRAGLIEAICERHESRIAEHRRLLVGRLPAPAQRTTAQLVEAYIEPIAVEMTRSQPSYWARFSERLLLDQGLRHSLEREPSPGASDSFDSEVLSTSPEADGGRPQNTRMVGSVTYQLLQMMEDHISYLPVDESTVRVGLATRFMVSGLARWEHDRELTKDYTPTLPIVSSFFANLASAILDAPTALPPHGQEEVADYYRRAGLDYRRQPLDLST